MNKDVKLSENLINELVKLYPKVKIPFYKDHGYYIDLLNQDIENYSFLDGVIFDLYLLELNETFPEKAGSISKFKMKKYDEIISFWKSAGFLEVLNSISPDLLFKNNKFEQKEFNNFKTDKVYISIDLKEANWQMFKKYVIQSDTIKHLSWSAYLQKYFNIPGCISNSKSFRQFVLGNTNPKRLQRLQSLEIQKIIDSLTEEGILVNVVGKSYDELIIEEENLILELDIPSAINLPLFATKLNLIKKLLNKLDIVSSIKLFSVTEHQNHGEFIRIKNFRDIETFKITKRELFAVEGTRFFIHFKNLILGIEELNDKDLTFINNGKKALWVL